MCIIVAKKKGIDLPKKDILENCYLNNSDGAGFMYNDNEKVVIKKGFFEFEKFYSELMKIDDIKNKDVVLHFRIATSGGINKEKCHPFALSDSVKVLNTTYLYARYGVAHNGVLSDYVKNSDNLSDTQNFIKEFLTPIYQLNKNFTYNKGAIKLISSETKGSRLAILNKNNMKLIGDFIEDDNGVYYSNTSYKSAYYYSYPKYFSYYNNTAYKTEKLELKKGDILYYKNDTNDFFLVDEDDKYYLLNSNIYEKKKNYSTLVLTNMVKR